MTHSFVIRQVRPGDLAHLWPLARLLNSYNLPADRRFLRGLVETSVASFRGALPRSRAKYLFVLERCDPRISPNASRFTHHASRVIGCSLIIAKHGTRALPHLWLDVKPVRMTSRALRRTVTHQVLRLGMTTDGPTEVGGLIVLPAYRGRPERLGRQLSYVRFAYMAMHPERFERDVLVEYLPPLSPDGESPLWQAFGQRFTGLSYHAADRLSATTKEFILRLFPRTPIYADFLPLKVRAQLGVVHPAAAGSCALLKAIGFRPRRQIEPFDGGPYYGAPRWRITLIRRTRAGALAVVPSVVAAPALVCTEPAAGEFRAVAAPARWSRGGVEVTPSTVFSIEGHAGMRAYVAPCR